VLPSLPRNVVAVEEHPQVVDGQGDVKGVGLAVGCGDHQDDVFASQQWRSSRQSVSVVQQKAEPGILVEGQEVERSGASTKVSSNAICSYGPDEAQLESDSFQQLRLARDDGLDATRRGSKLGQIGRPQVLQDLLNYFRRQLIKSRRFRLENRSTQAKSRLPSKRWQG